MRIGISFLCILFFASISCAQIMTVDEFLVSRSLNTAEAQTQAEQFRDSNGLLPDKILEAVYSDFWKVESSIREARVNDGGKVFIYRPKGTTDVIWPQTLNARDILWLDLEFEAGYRALPQFPAELASCPVIDMTGAHSSQLSNLRIKAVNSNYTFPACGLFLGRDAPLDNANFNVIKNISIEGNFGDSHAYGGACIVNVGCEVFHITENTNCRFFGKIGGAFFTSSYNNHRITSPHGTIAGGYVPGSGGAISNAGGVIDGSSHFACDGNPTGSNPVNRYVFKLGSRTHSVWIHDIYVTAKTQGGCGAVFVLGDNNDNTELYSGVSNIVISRMHDEAYSPPFFVRLDGKTRAVVVQDIGNIQAGAIVGYGSVYNSNWPVGLRLENLLHRPHPSYWSGGPAPVEVPIP